MRSGLQKDLKGEYSMEVFQIFIGSSKVKFSIVFELNKYRAKVNDIVLCEGADYESVRENLLVDMIPKTDTSKLH
jgi:hypothetical protein